MALATSLTSARVGVGAWIMLSSICVATMTGRPYSWQRAINLFWITGTSATSISTPRSPRATMMASDSSMMPSISSSACGFSILVMMGMASSGSSIAPPAPTSASPYLRTPAETPSSRRKALSSRTSFRERTKLSARKSKLRSTAKRVHARSFSVSADVDSSVSGRLIPLLDVIVPPLTTSQTSLRSSPSPSAPMQTSDTFPSSSSTRSRGLTSSTSGGYVVEKTAGPPGSGGPASRGAFWNSTRIPGLSSTPSPTTSPILILGPHRSPTMATLTPVSCAAERMLVSTRS